MDRDGLMHDATVSNAAVSSAAAAPVVSEPPGPAGIFDMILSTEAGRSDPYPLYEALRGDGPFVAIGPGMLAATGYAECDRLLREPRLLVHDNAYMDAAWPGWEQQSSLRSLSHSILETNPPDHGRVRRLISGVFTPRRLARMRDHVGRLAADLTDAMKRRSTDGSTVDFMADFAYPLPVNVICELLGVPESDRAWFRPIAHEISATVEPIDIDFPVANAAADQLSGYFGQLIEQRRAEPREDLISALVAAHDADPTQLSAVELVSNLVLLLVAGFETTTNLLGNGLRVLLDRPDALAALRADPSGTAACVEEMLRFDSPVQVTSRWTPIDLEVGDMRMPAGSEVCVFIGAANRDPLRFDRPGDFDPARSNNAPLSFGAGAHFCVGQALARMEAQVAFPLLLERFPTIALAGEPVRKDRITLRGYANLPVRL